MKSKIVFLVATVLYVAMTIAFGVVFYPVYLFQYLFGDMAIAHHGDVLFRAFQALYITLSVLILYGVPMLALFKLFLGRQLRSQRRERKGIGQSVCHFSKIYVIAFWGASVLYFIVVESFDAEGKFEKLLNNLFGNANANPPGDVGWFIWMTSMFLILGAPMFVLYLIFFGRQIRRQRRERRTKGDVHAI